MRMSVRLTLFACSLVLFTECSVQKRTLMPGYHVEWGGRQIPIERPESSLTELAYLKTMQFEQISEQRHAVAVSPTAFGLRTSEQVARMPRIPPKEVAVNPAPTEPQEPTPWAEAYEEQKKFGNTALGAIGLAVLLHAMGAPQVAFIMALVVGVIAFFLNRRMRREVLDLKELNGYDVAEERRQFRTGNRLLGGAVFAAVIAYIVLAILTVLAFIALIEAFFSW
jgi:hypothetical protein